MKIRVALTILAPVLLLGSAPAAIADDFDDWQAQQSGEFEDWVTEQDRAFAEMLERQWQAFERFEGRQFYSEPKPPQQPKTTDAVQRSDQPLPPAAPEEPAVAEFLGHSLRPPSWDAGQLGGILPESEAVAGAFRGLLRSDHAPLLRWLRERSEAWRLTDWGQMRLVRTVVRETTARPQLRPLVSWFLLIRLGHDVRLAHADDRFVLLSATRQDVYEKSYFRIDGQIYYALFDPVDGARLFSYAGQHQSVVPPDLAPRRHPRTRPEAAQAVLEGGDHRMPLEYDLHLARYYDDYPQLDLDHFLAAPLDPLLAESASRYWRDSELADASPLEQVNVLLAMVQALPYATDQEQFGVEKYMLPGEIFTHAASDCDDRTLLFSALVEHLVGVDTVNLLYPGHVAVAVAVPGEGDRWTIDGESYLVADPTYVGAAAGRTMARYRGEQPEVVGL